jgi:hypothetical protein
MKINDANLKPSSSISAGMSLDSWEFSDLILKNRFAQALEQGIDSYPVHRYLRFAARMELQDLFDGLALTLGLKAQRLGGDTLLLDGEGVFVTADGSHKTSYCSCSFNVWAADIARAERLRERILACVGTARITEPMFSIDWHFLTARGSLESAHIEELADDSLLDAAYPELAGGVAPFIEAYLNSPEAVLVLQGPPGTGKTRLIRAILGAISRRQDGEARALYTGDMKALECDQIFVKFITGWDDAFVIEDADHLLKPRADGNDHLHRFLTIADGVVRSQGRKIIFSTNLPNVGDLDEALIRPGRCYARIGMRDLTEAEAQRLLLELCAGNQAAADSALRSLACEGRTKYSLAGIYKAAAGAL